MIVVNNDLEFDDEGDFDGDRVVIITGDPELEEQLETVLFKEGIEAHSAANIFDLGAIIYERQPQLVIIDVAVGEVAIEAITGAAKINAEVDFGILKIVRDPHFLGAHDSLGINFDPQTLLERVRQLSKPYVVVA